MSTQTKPRRVFELANRYLPWVLMIVLAGFAYKRFVPSSDLGQSKGLAPAFSVMDLDGRPLDLGQYRGKVVVLNFWATWCPPCVAEVPGFVDIQRDMAPSGVQFVGVSLDQDGTEGVRAFMAKHRINYPVFIDDGRVASAYGGIGTVPTTFLIDREGNIRLRHEGILLEPFLRRSLNKLLKE